MKIVPKKFDEGSYEDYDYFDEYADALQEYVGGQVFSYSDGFEDEVYNYRQLLKFFGKYIVTEEQATSKIIDDAWNDGEDIRPDYSHVKSLREFTLHATFISIHSMYEGRLKEICAILKHFGKAKIVFEKRDNASGILNKIKKRLRLPADSKNDKKIRTFYNDVRNTLVHHKGYLSKERDADLIDKISINKFLILVKPSSEQFDFRVKITKSNFLTEYLTLIEQDLKTIYRSVIHL